MLRPVDTRRASVSLLFDRAHYEQVTLAIAEARTSVWISTANVKQLLVEAPIGTRARARGRYVPILDTLQSLCDRKVFVRLLARDASVAAVPRGARGARAAGSRARTSRCARAPACTSR